MKLIKTLKGGSLSETSVVTDGVDTFVRKSISQSREREYGLVRWHSQIRKLQLLKHYLPDVVPPIIRVGAESDTYFYDIPYYSDFITCSSAIESDNNHDLIARSLVNLLASMYQVTYGSTIGCLSVYVLEEIFKPLRSSFDFIDSHCLAINSDDKSYVKHRIQLALDYISLHENDYSTYIVSESLNHGNLTLENILYNPNTGSLVLIDPYAETYCDSIIGDISQIYQSCLSGYEFTVSYCERHDFSIFPYLESDLPAPYTRFYEHFTASLSTYPYLKSDFIELFRASQFTRMFPFKVLKDTNLAFKFLLHGVDLLLAK